MRGLCPAVGFAQRWLRLRMTPRPVVSEPETREHMKAGRIGPSVANRDAHQNVIRSFLSVFEKDVEVAVVIEDTCIDKLVLEVMARTFAICLDKIYVRVRTLRILIEVFHVAVCGCRVEVEVILLNVFAVVSLTVSKSEEALFKDRVALVPESNAKAKAVLVVRDPAKTVLAPTIRSRTRLFVAEVVPGVAVRAIVLPDRAPLPLTKVGAPLLPGDSFFTSFIQPFLRSGIKTGYVTKFA